MLFIFISLLNYKTFKYVLIYNIIEIGMASNFLRYIKDEKVKKLILQQKGWEELAFNIALFVYSCLHEDDDCLIVVDGAEGSGKSLFIRKVGHFVTELKRLWGVESEFGLENIHFTTYDYMNASLKHKRAGHKGHVNILDEAMHELDKLSFNSRKSKKFTGYLSEIRDANQVHIIALPAFHDLSSRIVLWRMRLEIHLLKEYVPDPTKPVGFRLKRGKFEAWTGRNKFLQRFYRDAQDRYMYPQSAEITGTFNGDDVVDTVAYKAKKAAHSESKYAVTDEGDLKKREISVKPRKRHQVILDDFYDGKNIEEITGGDSNKAKYVFRVLYKIARKFNTKFTGVNAEKWKKEITED